MGVSPMRGMAVPAMQGPVFRAMMALRRMAKMAMPRKNDFYHGLLGRVDLVDAALVPPAVEVRRQPRVDDL